MGVIKITTMKYIKIILPVIAIIVAVSGGLVSAKSSSNFGFYHTTINCWTCDVNDGCGIAGDIRCLCISEPSTGKPAWNNSSCTVAMYRF